MKVLVLGSGGREHALAWKLAQSPKVSEVVVAPGNGGTVRRASLDLADSAAIKRYCQTHEMDLVVVGPEAPLAAGLADDLRAAKVRVFGPGREGARLESSKIFAKAFMARHGVATAACEVFEGCDLARDYVTRFPEGVVIKYDGLAAGKGVFVCENPHEALDAIDAVASRYGDKAHLIIEERLFGRELSLIAFVAQERLWLLPPSQDHKQLLDGDRGPNTGGMGAFSPVPFFDDALAKEVTDAIIEPTLRGLKAEGIDYRGALFFGIMVTKSGCKLLEYNVRFGDPETEVLLPALAVDLVDVILACTDGGPKDLPPGLTLPAHDGAFVDVVLASSGYPGAYKTGQAITGLEDLDSETLVFHAGTQRDGDRVVTKGGRVLNIVCQGRDLDAARARVYREVEKIHFSGKTLRLDIGRRGDER